MKQILLIMIGISSILSADFSRDNTIGIVTDNTTTLQWQDNEIGTRTTWQGAIDRCEALTLGGQSDWRLPNINELDSLVDDSKVNPSIDTVFLYTVASSRYWSSTTNANYSSPAWVVYFNLGNQGNDNKDNKGYVRCVRAGQ